MPPDLPDISRIHLSPDLAAVFARIADTATAFDRAEAHSATVEELRALDLVQRVEIGPCWYLSRTGRGRALARGAG